MLFEIIILILLIGITGLSVLCTYGLFMAAWLEFPDLWASAKGDLFFKLMLMVCGGLVGVMFIMSFAFVLLTIDVGLRVLA